MVLESRQSLLGEEYPGPWPQPGSASPLPQAWLTEIHEYAQRDVVIMLLGNKVSGSVGEAVHSDPSLPPPQHQPHPAPYPPKSFREGTLRSPGRESDMSYDFYLSHSKPLPPTA